MQTTLSHSHHPFAPNVTAAAAAVVDPSLHHHHQLVDQQSQGSVVGSGVGPPPSTLDPNNPAMPMKRRPGRPKGSTKKNLLAGTTSPTPPKIKRPVGRPRKDGFPAGSVGPTRVKREKVQYPPYPSAMGDYGAFGGLPHPSTSPVVTSAATPTTATATTTIPAPTSASASTAPPPPVPYPIDPTLDRDEWATLSTTNPNAFLSTLLSALSSPNPVSSAGPTVEEAFKSHLVSLAPNPTQVQPIPSLYSILKTFWLPSSPAYFSLTASASMARTPSEHRFLYWDPQPLVFNGISCPNCSASLANKGRISTGPIKVYDIEKPFFIVGCEYVCKSPACVAATSSAEGRRFASTDSSILRSLPVKLKDEFPARLMYGDGDAGSGANVWCWRAMGVSVALWNMVVGGLRAGLRRDVILGLVWAIQNGVPECEGQVGQSQQQQQQQQAQQQAQQQHQEQMQMQHVDHSHGLLAPQHLQQQHHQHLQHHPSHRHEMDNDVAADNDDNDKMEEDQEDDDDDPSNHMESDFTDAYSNAWKENTAMSNDNPLQHHQHHQLHHQLQQQQQQLSPSMHPSPRPQPTTATTSTPTATPSTTTNSNSTATTSTTTSTHAAPSLPPLPSLPGLPSLSASASPAAFAPYAAYPFPPYAYMPHHIVNGQMVPLGMGGTNPGAGGGGGANGGGAHGLGVGMGVGSSLGLGSTGMGGTASANVSGGTNPNSSSGSGNTTAAGSTTKTKNAHHRSGSTSTPSATSNAAAAGTNAGAATTSTTTTTTTKRSPRHCCKCGSQECKGKGGRSFCQNACQDCGKLECNGRNSRRPDKKCSEGWS